MKRKIRRRPILSHDLETARPIQSVAHAEIIDARTELVTELRMPLQEPTEFGRIGIRDPRADGVPVQHRTEMVGSRGFRRKTQGSDIEGLLCMVCLIRLTPPPREAVLRGPGGGRSGFSGAAGFRFGRRRFRQRRGASR